MEHGVEQSGLIIKCMNPEHHVEKECTRYRSIRLDIDKLGKEAHIEGKARQPGLGGDVAPVDVDGVGHRLESVDTDSDREDQIQQVVLGVETHTEQVGGVDKLADEKIEVLEETEQAKVDAERETEPALAGRRSAFSGEYLLAADEVDHGAEDDEAAEEEEAEQQLHHH